MERLLLKTRLYGTAMTQGVHLTMQSVQTTDASPTAWNLVRRLSQRLLDRAQLASKCGDACNEKTRQVGPHDPPVRLCLR